MSVLSLLVRLVREGIISRSPCSERLPRSPPSAGDGPTETDRLLARMSLIELAHLPMGPEPRFVDTAATDIADEKRTSPLRRQL